MTLWLAFVMVAKLLNNLEMNIKWTNIFEIKMVGLGLCQKEKSMFLFVVKSMFSEGISCENDGECVSLFRISLNDNGRTAY